MPSAAERTRTLVQSTSSAVLLLPGPWLARPEQLMPEERSVGPDGEVLLVYPVDSPAVRAATHAHDDELPVVLEITDVAPVSVPNRIRGRAWVSGWLTSVRGVAEPGRMLLRLEVGEARVDDLWGTGMVDAEGFVAASPDPLVEHEVELLQHLHSAHGDQVRQLCGLAGDRAAGTKAVPLALDRFGLRVRFSGGADGRVFDARFDFREPVRDVVGLRRAMHELFEAAAH
ncbi:DUF2470 domain-containing protein [Streptomyces agglomeratus]|uniref:DUF2470 domain-containing protein n=1 Tax=Streptomyces agglomeratus TaxID=285458 RepID=A0A1E5PE84_9ACTN|nr:DUF2470 domain-containing protein [Streptomyces agglomeratus]OEJ27837.1 DUF2470 domain-containing protein [Streptomyces agglomeratus]OEJ38104.1 DUF2470 domain-containing protein [Streptomyces agglomeratus]OEJ47513.1 DUF2470 domain-containing protein [Streptomyces agglomeratus]OEJ50631.1 DUF2470 domain-containing protein [Streptomyces agglomeratus]OEJ57993.1 DUF2470 domain-containing protein [Streptomyces agglomeratus]